MRAPYLAASCTAAALLSAMASASAAVPDQDLPGVLRCDVIPGVGSKPLVQRVTVAIRNGVATMQREVRLVDTTVPSGFHEEVGGTVGPGGSLTLTGQGYAQTSGYSAEYAGTLPPPGGSARFTGAQHWHFTRQAPADRPCTLDLQRP